MSLNHLRLLRLAHAEQYNFSSVDYLNTSAHPYHYDHKLNATTFCDVIASVSSRLMLPRNFNDFTVDVNASALPQ